MFLSCAIGSLGLDDRAERKEGEKLGYSIWRERWRLSFVHGNSAERRRLVVEIRYLGNGNAYTVEKDWKRSKETFWLFVVTENSAGKGVERQKVVL